MSAENPIFVGNAANVPHIMKVIDGPINSGAIVPVLQPIVQRPSPTVPTPTNGTKDSKQK